MANMFIKYELGKHATANPSNLLAAEQGEHIFSVELTTDADNGNLIAIGDLKSFDLFKEKAVTTFTGKIVQKMPNGNFLVLVEDAGDACLVYNVPVAAEEFTSRWKNESVMYNKAGSIVRAYGLRKWDRFEVSAEGFTGTPEVGKSITGVADKKMTVGA